MDKKRGLFIVLEGIDGSGKSTQMMAIDEIMKRNYPNRKFITTREPGGIDNIVGEKIRDIILNEEMSNHTRALLYAASRYEHSKVIKKFLDDGYIVFCDRYIASSLAYQLDGDNLSEILDINRYSDLEKPDYIFYFDINKETYIERKNIRTTERKLDVLETDLDQKVDKIFENYVKALKCLEEDGTQVININANKPKGDIAFNLNKYLKVII